MTKCFWKFFWRNFWRFWVRCWFSGFFALKVFLKFFSGNREHGVCGGFWAFFLFGLPFSWFPVRVSIHLRLASDDSPFVFRSIFDRSSIPERRSNGESTENERRSNGARTELERRLNGGWTEVERRMNGGWTEDERRINGERSKTEWRANGGVDSLSQAFCVPSVWYRNAFGIVVRQNGACFSKLTSAKLQREKAKSKFSANLWHFKSAERWKWKYKANNGLPVPPLFDYLSKINISRASLTPLGRVFKIRKILP